MAWNINAIYVAALSMLTRVSLKIRLWLVNLKQLYEGRE